MLAILSAIVILQTLAPVEVFFIIFSSSMFNV